MFNIQDAIEQAAAVGPDMTTAQSGGGGDYTPPAAGPVRLRLVSYIELGVHDDSFDGKPKKVDKVALQFELSGPKHPPREFDGRKVPDLITINLNKSLNEKAGFFKLFKRLNHTGEYKHFAQLLGKAFLGTIVHKESGEGDKKRVYANLRDESGYTIRPPFREDFDTGESVPVQVDPALTPLKCFIWSSPVSLKDMWDSIFIDGMYEARKDDSGKETAPAKSKNHWQNTIRAANNFAGSPIAELLGAGGEPDLSAAAAVKPERSSEAQGASADPLAGM